MVLIRSFFIYTILRTTDDVTPSDNVLSCEVVKTYSDGCDVKVTASNNDPYIVEAQPKAAWDKFLSNNGVKRFILQQTF